MNIEKMKEISEAYERIQSINNDILSIQAAAERLLDSNSSAWIAIDLEDDLINQATSNNWQTTMSGNIFFTTQEKIDDDMGLSIEVPNLVAIEILGVLLRHKQKLISNENNNI